MFDGIIIVKETNYEDVFWSKLVELEAWKNTKIIGCVNMMVINEYTLTYVYTINNRTVLRGQFHE